MANLIIPQDLINKMVSLCRSVYPKEACGILAGRENVVEKIYKITNIENSTVSYQMEPKEQFHVMKKMRDDRTKMLAIYHSHPEFSAFPSAKDVNLAFYSDSAYVIVSLKDKVNPDIRAFEIVDGKVSEISIEIKK